MMTTAAVPWMEVHRGALPREVGRWRRRRVPSMHAPWRGEGAEVERRHPRQPREQSAPPRRQRQRPRQLRWQRRALRNELEELNGGSKSAFLLSISLYLTMKLEEENNLTICLQPLPQLVS